MGWVLTWLLVIAIPATGVTTCTMGSDDAWALGLLLYSPLLASVLVAIVLSRRHHARLLWLAMPHVVLVPWAVVFVWPFLMETSLGGHHLCAVLEIDPGLVIVRRLRIAGGDAGACRRRSCVRAG